MPWTTRNKIDFEGSLDDIIRLSVTQDGKIVFRVIYNNEQLCCLTMDTDNIDALVKRLEKTKKAAEIFQ